MDSTKKNAILRLDLMAEENGLPRYSELVEAMRYAVWQRNGGGTEFHNHWSAKFQNILAKLPEGR